MDTLGIENFISVQHRRGAEAGRRAGAARQGIRGGCDEPAARKAQADPCRAAHRDPARERRRDPQGKTVILSTGARWREMNVPGEAEYKARACFCPHCDGPLFKGKRVAVIGGGNSASRRPSTWPASSAHVTLLEFADQLRADAVLQDKLRSLPNVTVIKQAQTTEVVGDGQKVTGLRYKGSERQRGRWSSWPASSCRSACCPTPTG